MGFYKKLPTRSCCLVGTFSYTSKRLLLDTANHMSVAAYFYLASLMLSLVQAFNLIENVYFSVDHSTTSTFSNICVWVQFRKANYTLRKYYK